MESSTTNLLAILFIGLMLLILTPFGLWDFEFDGFGLF
jgi:hypothetical protein